MIWWKALGVVASLVYVLAMIFVVPRTFENYFGATVIFASFAFPYTCYSLLIREE